MNQYWKGETTQVPRPKEWVDPHDNGVHAKFVCKCGGDAFRVFSHEGYYKTYVECVSCGSCDPDLGNSDYEDRSSTVVHSG